jgi:hypothetical protein
MVLKLEGSIFDLFKITVNPSQNFFLHRSGLRTLTNNLKIKRNRHELISLDFITNWDFL